MIHVKNTGTNVQYNYIRQVITAYLWTSTNKQAGDNTVRILYKVTTYSPIAKSVNYA